MTQLPAEGFSRNRRGLKSHMTHMQVIALLYFAEQKSEGEGLDWIAPVSCVYGSCQPQCSPDH